MIYETKKKKPRRHPVRWALIKFFLSLLLILATLAGLLAGALYIAPLSLLMLDPEQPLDINGELPPTHMNVLLLGVDVENYGQRSDSMMILSVGEEELLLTSLMRDMIVEIPGYGEQKLNAAHAHGGPELAMRTVNRAFDMNICKYVRVDYLALVRIVDALDGIFVEITKEERDKVNELVAYHEVTLKKDGYWVEPLTGYGKNTHLNGIQALSFARIRKLDSDYNRTGRQRQVMQAIWNRVRIDGVNLKMVLGLWKVLQEDVDTNLNWLEMGVLGMKALRASGIENHRLPADGTFKDDYSALHIDEPANAAALQQWIYGN